MKKIMIALATIAMAAVSQAAIVNWSVNQVKMGDNIQLGATCQLWLVGVNGADDVMIDTRTTTTAGGASTKGRLTAGAGSAQDAYKYNQEIAGGAVWNAEGTITREVYMVVLSNTPEGYSYTTDAIAISGLSDTAAGTAAFGTLSTATAVSGTGAWVASVPEPTSGLLMLVGLAGLALRRRRA